MKAMRALEAEGDAIDVDLEAVKEQGNALLKEGKHSEAISKYTVRRRARRARCERGA